MDNTTEENAVLLIFLDPLTRHAPKNGNVDENDDEDEEDEENDEEEEKERWEEDEEDEDEDQIQHLTEGLFDD